MSHGPRSLSFADSCRNLLKRVIINIARETDLFEGLAIWTVWRKADYSVLFWQ
jgi:hypothetical protein